jgi:hypothetical protein
LNLHPLAILVQAVHFALQPVADQTLNIPEKAKIIKLSKKQAHAQFYRQMAVWEGRAVPEPEPVIVVEPNVESEIQDTSDAILVQAVHFALQPVADL